ncbi:hypothetical protein F4167_18170 [Candidatus Poribacteria bacterium]|nr:hypothetical protein [Candidatus Poribacteria bacterium]
MRLAWVRDGGPSSKVASEVPGGAGMERETGLRGRVVFCSPIERYFRIFPVFARNVQMEGAKKCRPRCRSVAPNARFAAVRLLLPTQSGETETDAFRTEQAACSGWSSEPFLQETASAPLFWRAL